MLGVVDGLLVVVLMVIFGLLYHLKDLISQIEAKLYISVEDLKQTASNPMSLESLKDEVLDIVESTIENLTPPTAIDHIVGAASQYFQMKMMRDFQINSPMELVDKVKDTVETVTDAISND